MCLKISRNLRLSGQNFLGERGLTRDLSISEIVATALHNRALNKSN